MTALLRQIYRKSDENLLHGVHICFERRLEQDQGLDPNGNMRIVKQEESKASWEIRKPIRLFFTLYDESPRKREPFSLAPKIETIGPIFSMDTEVKRTIDGCSPVL